MQMKPACACYSNFAEYLIDVHSLHCNLKVNWQLHSLSELAIDNLVN